MTFCFLQIKWFKENEFVKNVLAGGRSNGIGLE